jgi:hypothetical protein
MNAAAVLMSWGEFLEASLQRQQPSPKGLPRFARSPPASDADHAIGPPRHPIHARNPMYAKAAMAPAIGMVRIHAHTIRPATPHLTAEIR